MTSKNVWVDFSVEGVGVRHSRVFSIPRDYEPDRCFGADEKLGSVVGHSLLKDLAGYLATARFGDRFGRSVRLSFRVVPEPEDESVFDSPVNSSAGTPAGV